MLTDEERAAAIARHEAKHEARRQEGPPELKGRLAREHLTMRRMVEIYCHDHHGVPRGSMCADCAGFLDYSGRRLEKCPYGEEKPTCARCPIHCYKPAPRDLAKTIMRYAGPRMTWRHPWLAFLHLTDKLRRVEHPMEARRRSRD